MRLMNFRLWNEDDMIPINLILGLIFHGDKVRPVKIVLYVIDILFYHILVLHDTCAIFNLVNNILKFLKISKKSYFFFRINNSIF